MNRLLKIMIGGLAVASLSMTTAYADPQNEPNRVAFYKALEGKRVVLLPMAMGFDLAKGWAHWIGKDVKHNGGIFETRDPNWSVDAGAQALTELIASKPDAIVVHNPDVQSYARLIKRAQEAGIYIVQVENRSSTPSDVFVGGDWFKIGELEGAEAAKACGDGTSGKVALLKGDEVTTGSLDQEAGIKAELAKHPNIKVVAEPVTNWDATKARALTGTVLQQNTDLCAVIDFWDGSAQGTAAAIRDSQMTDKLPLITNGGGEQADCDALQSGTFAALVNTDVPGQSRDINNAVKMLLQAGKPAGTFNISLFTPDYVWTKADLKPGLCWSLKDVSAN